MNKFLCKFSWLFLFSFLFFSDSYAMACKETANSNTLKNFQITEATKLMTEKQTAGAVLWRSSTVYLTLRCVDDLGRGVGEYAYFYLDPLYHMNNMDPSVRFGVNVNGKDYKLNSGGKAYIGVGTLGNGASRRECLAYGNNSPAQKCAKSQVVKVNFYIYLYATGIAPVGKSIIKDSQAVNVLQAHGNLGVYQHSQTYKVYASGLERIKIFSCDPKIRIEGNKGSEVSFGRIYAKKPKVGQVAASANFTVTVDYGAANIRNQCKGLALIGKLISNNKIKDANMLIPSESANTYGIHIYDVKNKSKPIDFNKNFDIGVVNDSVIRKEYVASLKWLSEKPKSGKFNAAATIEVTLR